MKKITLLLIAISSITMVAQDMTFTFENAEVTNDGSNDFYEVDVFVSSTSEFKYGLGQFYVNYNTLAFGTSPDASGTFFFEQPAGSILDQGIDAAAGAKFFTGFHSVDNFPGIMSVNWQHGFAASTIANNNVSAIPALLCHLRFQFIDNTLDPMICFNEALSDGNNAEACGPYTSGNPFELADCVNYLPTVIVTQDYDCTGAEIVTNICSGTTTIWQGFPLMWSNGTPTGDSTDTSAFQEVIIDASLTVANIIAENDVLSFAACSIIITSNGRLRINSDQYVFVHGNIEVEFGGELIIYNQGSLVQVDDMAIVINNGSISVNKETTSVGINGFSIIGSPMSLSTREVVYVNQGLVRHHTTANFIPNAEVGNYDPMAENFADDNGNDWQTHTGIITPAEGYLVKSSNPGDPNTTINVNYTEGTLNNGIYTYAAEFYTDQNSSPNVLSNPYASAIVVTDFITANSGVVDAVYFWEHQTVNGADTNYPGYKDNNYDMGDISMRNLIGPNQAPNGGFVPGTTIASGQGFAIKALMTDAVVFNNAMRTTGPNDQYRNPNPIEIERMNLSLKNEAYGLKSSLLVGFTENASEGFDSGYDAKRLATPISLYSVLGDMELAIQGRSTFNTDQIIPLGFRTQIEEEQSFTISLGNLEGDLISTATVYLQDNLLHISTNLSEEDYTFTSNESNQKDRFVIVFTEEQLGNDEVSLETISLYPNPTRDIVNINSPLVPISNIEVFDLRGRKVDVIKVNYQNSYQLNMIQLKTGVYFIKINTENGTITKRIIKE